MALYEASPMTQRTASTRLDLPQPLGPTTPVSPGSISKSVGSTKDLNPIRRSRVSFMRLCCPSAAAAGEGIRRRLKLLELEPEGSAASARRMNRQAEERNTAAALSRLSGKPCDKPPRM